MNNEGLVNQVRAFYFMLGVLKNQYKDPNCAQCLSLAKNLDEIKSKFNEFERLHSAAKEDLPEKFREQFMSLYDLVSQIQKPDNPIGQRKTGNCKFREMRCIIQESIAVYEKLMVSS